MSQISGVSVGSHNVGENTLLDVPEYYWRCTEKTSLRVSRSEGNPNRRYFRCDLAHEQKMANDGHAFGWLDDALLQEVKILKQKNADLEKDISDLVICLGDFAASENEEKKEVKKMKVMLFTVIGAVVLLGLSRFI